MNDPKDERISQLLAEINYLRDQVANYGRDDAMIAQLRAIIAQARLELFNAKRIVTDPDKLVMVEWALHHPEFTNGLNQTKQE